MINISKTTKVRHIVITKGEETFYIELQPDQELITGEGTYEVLTSQKAVTSKYGNIIKERD